MIGCQSSYRTLYQTTTINEAHLTEGRPDVGQIHELRRTNNTRLHHLHWDDHEMKTGIPYKNGNQAAAIIDILGKSISKLVSLCAAVLTFENCSTSDHKRHVLLMCIHIIFLLKLRHHATT